MDNLDKLISEANLTHRAISNGIGNSDNWFNDAFNNNEDIQVSSLTRVLSVISEEIDLKEYKITSLFDKKILEIASLIGKLSDEDERYIFEFIKSDKNIFTDMLGDWASMEYRDKLNDAEKQVLAQVKECLAEGEDV